jgi:hypothetical protein
MFSLQTGAFKNKVRQANSAGGGTGADEFFLALGSTQVNAPCSG